MTVSLTNPTGRNTECRALHLGGVTLFFSYSTLIGYETVSGGHARIVNEWGPTSGRHFNECGLADAPIVTPQDLASAVRNAIAQA